MKTPERALPRKLLLVQLLFILFFLGFFSLKAQKSDSSQVETILKINPETGTPLNKSQLKWVIKKGFEAQNYDWQNNEVNLLIKKSINWRNTSKVPGILGTTGLTIAVLSHFFIPPGQNIPQSDIDQNNYNRTVIAISSASLIITSIIFKEIAKKKVRKANKRRLSLSSR